MSPRHTYCNIYYTTNSAFSSPLSWACIPVVYRMSSLIYSMMNTGMKRDSLVMTFMLKSPCNETKLSYFQLQYYNK